MCGVLSEALVLSLRNALVLRVVVLHPEDRRPTEAACGSKLGVYQLRLRVLLRAQSVVYWLH
jgi:hypothetical protein